MDYWKTFATFWARVWIWWRPDRFIHGYGREYWPRRFRFDSGCLRGATVRDIRLSLIHIQECIEKVLSYTSGLDCDWREVPIVVDAVCRNIEIIGEAANRLGETYRAEHADVPWRSIIGARNVLIHGYDIVEPLILQEIVERDLSKLRECKSANYWNDSGRAWKSEFGGTNDHIQSQTE